jgi:hypothetical protein
MAIHVFSVIPDFLTSLLKCEYCERREREYLIERKLTIPKRNCTNLWLRA